MSPAYLFALVDAHATSISWTGHALGVKAADAATDRFGDEYGDFLRDCVLERLLERAFAGQGA